ncbi:hypothetical protein [Megasphaera sp. DJF_B143]|nr:hypothetical protein [Megasphaera sp. DJF_B143]
MKSSIRYLKAHAGQFGIAPERVRIIGGQYRWLSYRHGSYDQWHDDF